MSLKVYYLDDEVDLLEVFSATYANESVQITTFNDPKKAIQAVQDSRPDLIFIDYRLPLTTGDAVAKSLPADLPKVLITGDLTVTNDSLFISVLSKPCKNCDVESILQKYQK